MNLIELTGRPDADREKLTAAFLERGEMDSDATISWLCMNLTVTELSDAATQCGIEVKEPGEDAEEQERTYEVHGSETFERKCVWHVKAKSPAAASLQASAGEATYTSYPSNEDNGYQDNVLVRKVNGVPEVLEEAQVFDDSADETDDETEFEDADADFTLHGVEIEYRFTKNGKGPRDLYVTMPFDALLSMLIDEHLVALSSPHTVRVLTAVVACVDEDTSDYPALVEARRRLESLEPHAVTESINADRPPSSDRSDEAGTPSQGGGTASDVPPGTVLADGPEHQVREHPEDLS